LVSTVVPSEDLVRTGDEIISQLLTRRRDALRAVKKFLDRARLQDFEQAADYGANLLAITLSSQ
jgi:enoyl-CoA hydratase/carnithine racemase